MYLQYVTNNKQKDNKRQYEVIIKFLKHKRPTICYSNLSIYNMLHVVFSLLGDSPVSEFYVPTVRNDLSVPSYTIYEDWTYSVPKPQQIKSDARESP